MNKKEVSAEIRKGLFFACLRFIGQESILEMNPVVKFPLCFTLHM